MGCEPTIYPTAVKGLNRGIPLTATAIGPRVKHPGPSAAFFWGFGDLELIVLFGNVIWVVILIKGANLQHFYKR